MNNVVTDVEKIAIDIAQQHIDAKIAAENMARNVANVLVVPSGQ